ncbi:MAG: VacJ family lipoprotein [Holosporaceae bacterium]|jgi:phospholipid-binding lipoprotein MlaA|nr:VacJ family lipoprotein [Holosporaceae bacterium]
MGIVTKLTINKWVDGGFVVKTSASPVPNRYSVGIAGFLLLTLCSCSSTRDNPDPHEEFNRDIHGLNLAIDKNILRPVAMTYKETLPDAARESISNFLINLKEPFYCLNYLLTLDDDRAANSFLRFIVNSTIGILGIFDIGEEMDLKKAETSHMGTLKKWDMPTGDYLVLPILGSSSTRDAIGEPISWFADPMGYIIGFPYMVAKAVLAAIGNRAENSDLVDSTIRDSFDLYSTTRSVYLQKYGNDEDSNDAEEND